MEGMISYVRTVVTVIHVVINVGKLVLGVISVDRNLVSMMARVSLQSAVKVIHCFAVMCIIAKGTMTLMSSKDETCDPYRGR
jgi:hypothetical protein